MQNKTKQVEARYAALTAATPKNAIGSRLPVSVQEVVAGHLRAGLSISETARRCDLSRDQVRTVKYALFGLTLAEVRTLKRELRQGAGLP